MQTTKARKTKENRKEVGQMTTREEILKLTQPKLNQKHYLTLTKKVLDEWLDETIKDGNVTTAEAFAVAIGLIYEKLNS